MTPPSGSIVYLRADGRGLRRKLLGGEPSVARPLTRLTGCVPEIRRRRVRLEPESGAHDLPAALQACAPDLRLCHAGERTLAHHVQQTWRRTGPGCEGARLHRLLLLVHNPPRSIRHPHADCGQLY